MSTVTLPALRPVLRLADLYPSGCVLNPREQYGGNPFVAENTAVSDALTGPFLPLAGELPVLCHDFVATQRVRDVVRAAGFDWAASAIRYHTESQYRHLLGTRQPSSVVFQHAHAPERADLSLYHVPRTTLVALNDKARLPELAPAHAVPRRSVVPVAELRSGRVPCPAPVVLKVPSEHSLGSGEGVRLCRTAADVDRALAELSAAGELVVEEFARLAQNWCVQFACLPDGRVRYLGSAEQVVDARGVYRGNWITAGQPPRPVVEVGRELAVRGVRAGYRGVAGFDIAVTDEGRVLVLDLNFRVNGSTVGIVYRSSIQDTYAVAEVRFHPVSDARGWPHLAHVLGEVGRGGRILPFAGYDPGTAPVGSVGSVARASLLVTGGSRAEVADIIERLRRLGVQ